MTRCVSEVGVLADMTTAPAADPAMTLGAPDEDRGSLPVGGLLGLVGSGAFAVWTSLTCFVC